MIDRDTVLIEGTGRQWYRAKLIGPCFDLPFAERIGFKTDGSGSFDRYSTLIVRGQRCPLISLTKSDPPPKKQKGKPTLERAQNPVQPAMETGLEPK